MGTSINHLNHLAICVGKRLKIRHGKVVLEEREIEPVTNVTHVYNNTYKNIYVIDQKEPIKILSGSVWDHGICENCGKAFYVENQEVCENCGNLLSGM